MAHKAYWLHQALEHFAGRKEEKEIRAYAKQQGIVADPKSARRHWSGLASFVWEVATCDHPLDGPTTSTHKKTAYAADYFQTSAFVHCSLPAIDNYYTEDEKRFCILNSCGPRETGQSTLFIILIYLHASIAYVLFGMNVERPSKLNALLQRDFEQAETSSSSSQVGQNGGTRPNKASVSIYSLLRSRTMIETLPATQTATIFAAYASGLIGQSAQEVISELYRRAWGL